MTFRRLLKISMVEKPPLTLYAPYRWKFELQQTMTRQLGQNYSDIN